MAWAKAGDAPKKDTGMQQGPCPLPILPAASQGQGSPSTPWVSPVILHPKGACFSCSWLHPWGTGMWIWVHQAPCTP